MGSSASDDAHYNNSTSAFRRAHDFGIGFDGYGLVTEFVEGNGGQGQTINPTPNPEPVSATLGVMSLIAITAVTKRRRSSSSNMTAQVYGTTGPGASKMRIGPMIRNVK